MSKRPDIFEYLNFRNYLKDYTEFLREQGQFSTRTFAKKIGFGSNAQLSLIIQGKRSLNEDYIPKFSEAFDLNEEETMFLGLLVRFGQAKAMKETDEYYKKILKHKKFKDSHKLAEAQYQLYSKWYYLPILEAMNSEFGSLSSKEMADRAELTEEQVVESLNVLKQLDLIEKMSGRWIRKETQLRSVPETNNLNVRNLHREMLSKAEESLDNISPEERAFSALTVPLTEKSYDQLKAKIFDFLTDCNAELSGGENSGDVFHMSVQLFPVIRTSKKKSD
jgi:uncharacterized protein (TIGR02147 family)